MAPKVTEAHREARRQQILEASFACFAREGFHQTTMQDICREAELSPGAVYGYFQGKEDIIHASFEQCQAHALEVIGSATRQEDTVAVLDQLVEHMSVLDAAEAAVWLRMTVQLWAEALRSPALMDAHSKVFHDIWRQALTGIFSRARDLGEIDPDLDPQAVAQVLMSLWHGLELQKALYPELDISKYGAVVRAMYSSRFWTGPPPDGARAQAPNDFDE
ncbi:MAG: TetR/AcrR family transcriptional regulator [Chloroflexi bacterium]|nr:TetR/AcrR family transcriptional regulator [Chloroflexota bacterium]